MYVLCSRSRGQYEYEIVEKTRASRGILTTVHQPSGSPRYAGQLDSFDATDGYHCAYDDGDEEILGRIEGREDVRLLATDNNEGIWTAAVQDSSTSVVRSNPPLETNRDEAPRDEISLTKMPRDENLGHGDNVQDDQVVSWGHGHDENRIPEQGTSERFSGGRPPGEKTSGSFRVHSSSTATQRSPPEQKQQEQQQEQRDSGGDHETHSGQSTGRFVVHSFQRTRNHFESAVANEPPTTESLPRKREGDNYDGNSAHAKVGRGGVDHSDGEDGSSSSNGWDGYEDGDRDEVRLISTAASYREIERSPSLPFGLDGSTALEPRHSGKADRDDCYGRYPGDGSNVSVNRYSGDEEGHANHQSPDSSDEHVKECSADARYTRDGRYHTIDFSRRADTHQIEGHSPGEDAHGDRRDWSDLGDDHDDNDSDFFARGGDEIMSLSSDSTEWTPLKGPQFVGLGSESEETFSWTGALVDGQVRPNALPQEGEICWVRSNGCWAG